ncbi:hypothetical protein COLO4_23791 [Corchorus olitorius]|uniref:Protein kinase domain-containing protein n=1 Tax=Corchorus olitorius TaxID=93759 RepID=A0A1R3IEI2_9ROSI|nr:hypothetical protein COLO4_23791 [Corchorus olitorius]
MDSSFCHVCFLICSVTCILQLLQNQIVAHSLFNIHHPLGIPINVTKQFSFPNFTLNNEIKLLGSAKLSETQGFIQIPDPNPSPPLHLTYQAGRAIYSSPLRLFDPLTKTPASFQTTFSFQFKTIAAASATSDDSVSTQKRGGDGLAFVIVPDELTVGRSGPWLGILNDACQHYNVFAVEFDNNYDPKFGDPNDDHVGINLGSVVSFKTANLSVNNVSLHDDDSVHRAWIMYDGDKKWIDIYLGFDGYPIPSLPLLSSPLNLSPFLNEYMFVGFSASTGDLTQIHNILSWNFSSSVKALLSVPSKHVCHKNVAHQVSKYSTAAKRSDSPSNFTVFLCVVGLSTIALLGFYYGGKHRHQAGADSSLGILAFPAKKQKPVPPSKPRRFTISELYVATRRFSKSEILGSNSRGVLYRGTLMPNGRHVAVKRFSTKTPNSLSFRLDWNRILKRISSLVNFCDDHPNLAAIRGWCYDNRETIIVYDYFHNGTLDKWLFGLGTLSWARRFEVINDIAQTLSFLHSKELFHGNLNTSSIFIDTNYRAVLGDYGFMSLSLGGGGSRRVGSFISRKKADVFMFGVLVLEIVAGKSKVESQSDDETGDREEMDLLGFAWRMHERGEKLKIIDERIESCVDLDQAIRVIEIGLSCTSIEKNGRPSMEEVVLFLNMQS